MRVGVTGADGFTGRYLVPELERRGHDVIAIDTDVTDAFATTRAVTSAAPDALIHLAARAFVADKDYAGVYAVNQIGTFHLLDAVAQVNPGARVILASSAQVYGAQAAGLLAEDRPILPTNHYGLSKAAMEAGSQCWCDRLQIIVTRPFNYTGVGQESRYLVPKIVSHFRDRAGAIELGNLDVRRDFGDVRSVVEAYTGLLDVDEPPSVVNVAAGTLESVRGIVARLTALTGHMIDVRVNPAFVRADDVPELGGNVSRLRATLPDWQPRALEDTLEWMLRAA